jgi:hypothetical protein
MYVRRLLLPLSAMILSVLLFTEPAQATAEDGGRATGIQVGGFAGTTGAGYEAAVRLNSFCLVRVGHSNLDFDVSSTYREIPYHYTSDISWTTAVLDLYPGTGKFHFSAGAAFNSSDVRVAAFTEEPLSVGYLTYSPDQLGEIRGTVSIPGMAPYFGVGFGNRPAVEPGLTFSLDFGLLFQGYTVDLWHEGGSLPPELDAVLDQNIEVEQGFLQDQFDRLDIYPVVTLALGLRI